MTRGSDCASAAVPSMSMRAVVEHDDPVGERGDEPHVVLDDHDGDVVRPAQARARWRSAAPPRSAGGPAAGSSSSSSLGLMSRARHSSTPLCRPCESSSAGRCAAHPRPLRSRRSQRLGAQLLLGAGRARQPHRPLDRAAGQPGVGAEKHVLEHRLVQLQRRMLERARQAVPGERRRDARRCTSASSMRIEPAARLVVPADAVEQRGLARAVGPDEPEDLARLDGERHVLQHLDAAEPQAHVLQGQLSGHAHLSLRRVVSLGHGSGRRVRVLP